MLPGPCVGLPKPIAKPFLHICRIGRQISLRLNPASLSELRLYFLLAVGILRAGRFTSDGCKGLADKAEKTLAAAAFRTRRCTRKSLVSFEWSGVSGEIQNNTDLADGWVPICIGGAHGV